MARRIIDIPGRFLNTDVGLNLGPTLSNSVKPTGSAQEIQWTSPWLVETASSFQLMTDTWVYPTDTVTVTPYRNRNSGGGAEDSITVLFTGRVSWNFNVSGGSSSHFDITLPNGTFPVNQWVHFLHASDMTDPLLANRVFEHTLNGVLVPASSRSSDTRNNNQNGFGNPHANTHDVFLMTTPAAGARYWMAQDFLDLTNTDNVDKFIDRVNYRPIQLGPTGSNPTGQKPIIFMQNDLATILENLGNERDADALDGAWVNAGHNPTSPARFAHQTASNPNQSGLELTGSALGLTDTQQFSLSMWFLTASTTSAGVLVRCSDNSSSDRLVIEYNTSGRIQVTARNSAGTTILSSLATADDISDNAWHHIAVSINMQAAAAADAVRMFVDDVDVSPNTSTFVGSASINLGQTGLSFGILNLAADATLTNGVFSQFWCAPGVFVDFNVAATRAKYVQTTTTHIPIDLGDNGETPTGVSPIIFTGEGPTFVDGSPYHNANKGSAGGTFTVSRNAWVSPPSNPAFTQLGN